MSLTSQQYPVLKLTDAQFNAVPTLSADDLKYVPFGTFFKCKPDPKFPEVKVIGQIVKGLEMFSEQWGAGLSVPERGINRYRVAIDNEEKTEA